MRKHDVQAETPEPGAGWPEQRTLRLKHRWHALSRWTAAVSALCRRDKQRTGTTDLPRDKGGRDVSSGERLMGMVSGGERKAKRRSFSSDQMRGDASRGVDALRGHEALHKRHCRLSTTTSSSSSNVGEVDVGDRGDQQPRRERERGRRASRAVVPDTWQPLLLLGQRVPVTRCLPNAAKGHPSPSSRHHRRERP